MRHATVKLITFAGGRNIHLATIKDKTFREIALEIRDTFCPQVAYSEIIQALFDAVEEDDRITFFGNHTFGVEVVSISELKARVPVVKTEYAYNVDTGRRV